MSDNSASQDHKKFENYVPPELRSRPIYRRMPAPIRNIWDAAEQFLGKIAFFITSTVKRIPLWLSLIFFFIVGAGIGAFIIRQRKEAADVIVAVNGEPLTAGEFHTRMEMTAGSQILDTLIGERLLSKYARERGIAVTSTEIDERIKRIATSPNFSATVDSHHLTYNDIHEAVQTEILKEKLFSANIPVTEQEIEAYYRNETDPNNPKAQYYRPCIMSVRVITSYSEDDIRKAWNELQRGGKFEALVHKYGKGQIVQQDGLVPNLFQGRNPLSKIPGFEQTIFKLGVGDVTQPVQISGGWWIIRCEDKQPPVTLPLDQVREETRLAIQLAKSSKSHAPQISADFAEYRKKAKVIIRSSRYHDSTKTTGAPAQTGE